jgi:hypothetical protein
MKCIYNPPKQHSGLKAPFSVYTTTPAQPKYRRNQDIADKRPTALILEEPIRIYARKALHTVPIHTDRHEMFPGNQTQRNCQEV